MELKTLKDIDGIYSNGNGGIGPFHINIDKLQEAVIEWIKKLDNTDEHFVALLSGVTEHDMKVMSDTFKHFFNLTEDDLK